MYSTQPEQPCAIRSEQKHNINEEEVQKEKKKKRLKQMEMLNQGARATTKSLKKVYVREINYRLACRPLVARKQASKAIQGLSIGCSRLTE
jgi:hypothetical protein